MNEHITRRLRFENSSGIIYDRDSDDTMYESVVHTPNEAELHHMTMTCPNCGAVNPVSALTQGCPYCNTIFQVKDLYQRITNTSIPARLFMSYFITLIGGGFWELILSSVLVMTKQFNRDGRKRIPFWAYVTTKGKINRAFAPYDPYFSFEKFYVFDSYRVG